MRSFKLVPLVTAAAALLALAPAGASARRAGIVQPHGVGPCHIHLEVPKSPIPSGEAVTIVGALRCPPKIPAGGHQVTLYQQSAPSSSFAPVGTATTEGNGAFQVTPPVFMTNSVFYAVAEGAQSARKSIRVSAPITAGPPTPVEGAQLFTGAGRGLRRHNRVTFAGVVSPQDKGALVVLQRESSTATEEWHPIDRSTVDASGKYSIVHTFHIPGDANLRVVVHPYKINAPSATSPTSYEISSAENPALTLETTVDPLLYGSSTTLKGVVAGAKDGTPVTLLARARGGQFATAATGHTNGSGAYEFTQTPLTNTLYRVTSGATQSAALFEGVKYALTVLPTASTVQAGQPLTFSGSVQPALTGHTIYLERQGSLKLGWHVIDVGTVGAPSHPGEAAPFSIIHQFGTAGPEVLRIKIPGDPGNQGAAGAPNELNVTPAPASALRPEAPGTGKLPGEGQL
ncbi:MAG: hypothetical protein ACYDHT_02980 [Solirubrobacteraceae bacterium]